MNYGPFISGKKKEEEEEDVSVAIRCVYGGGSYKGGSFVFPTRSSQKEKREKIFIKM